MLDEAVNVSFLRTNSYQTRWQILNEADKNGIRTVLVTLALSFPEDA